MSRTQAGRASARSGCDGLDDPDYRVESTARSRHRPRVEFAANLRRIVAVCLSAVRVATQRDATGVPARKLLPEITATRELKMSDRVAGRDIDILFTSYAGPRTRRSRFSACSIRLITRCGSGCGTTGRMPRRSPSRVPWLRIREFIAFTIAWRTCTSGNRRIGCGEKLREAISQKWRRLSSARRLGRSVAHGASGGAGVRGSSAGGTSSPATSYRRSQSRRAVRSVTDIAC